MHELFKRARTLPVLPKRNSGLPSSEEERRCPEGPRDRWELRFPAATGNARLPLVALGPESSGPGSTLALARIHAGALAQLGRPRLRQSNRGQKRKEAPLALARIHAGAPAQPGRPPLRQSYRGQKHKEARGGD
ncbi:hypothetical protein NDU88_006280 [Pleurodeles waltl]|uniref:Uncharacterized protein n=1 Tax=Pleurodeles waltl TaxID=8319 RepID=A0AAV7MH23_PLEWA|nr:hypothetical protein NDU88_006280 [Pleurodeles waltl]